MNIPDFAKYGAAEHILAAEVGLREAVRVAADALELAATMNGDPDDLALLTLKQQNVQIYLAEAQVHATLAVAKK